MNDPFVTALRRLGFEKESVCTLAGERLKTYEKQIDDRRRLTVQLWSGGLRRVTGAFLGCTDTAPTEFASIEEMREAIAFESTRTDSKYSAPGSLYSEQIEGHLERRSAR